MMKRRNKIMPVMMQTGSYYGLIIYDAVSE